VRCGYESGYATIPYAGGFVIFAEVGMNSEMKGYRVSLVGITAALAFGWAAGSAFGQTAPPDELVLQGKVRDFVEANATVAPSHPHFLGNKPFTTCSAQQLGVDIAAADIDTTDDPGDTSVFKGDERGPRLLAPLDPRAAACFDQPSRFSDWYNDKTEGDVNRAFLIDIRFVRDTASGVYAYADDAFFPIDQGKAFTKLGPKAPFGNLLPAPNNNHDFGFTMEFHARFTYFKGRNQVFKFRGDDDVWVFVNGKKAIDLGGIHPSQDAAFNLDSIAATHGLKDSLVYPLDFFFAERHTTTSMLRISTTLELEPVTSPPSLTAGRLFDGNMTVTLAHTAADAVMYYTTDGSVPTVKSPKYTGPFAVSATTTVKAIAVRPGYRPSEPVEQTYTRMETVATPKADPPGRTFTDPIQVVLTDATPGAVIRYTLNGGIPDSNSPVYAGPIAIESTTTVKAPAFLADWVPSAVMTEIYTDAATLPPPVAEPGQSSFVTAITVKLSVPGHPEAQIHYTLDNSEPTAASPLYRTPLDFSATTTLKARAFQPDLHPSQVLTQVYTRLAEAVKAVYVDANGDGRIDGAVIRLDIAVSAVPAWATLTDPFGHVPWMMASSRFAQSADGKTLTVRFADQPFAPGTAFATADLGVFPNSAGFSPAPFAISDSAGPVPLKAVSHNKATPADQASVDVTFSEPIDLASLRMGPDWPFAILRDGAREPRPVEVARIEAVPGQADTYRFTFTVESQAWPVYTDSLELAVSPLVHDAGGTAGVPGGKRIPVQGGPLTVINDFEIEVISPIKPQLTHDGPASWEVRANPFAVVAETRFKELVCLNCARGTEAEFLSREIPPEWIIRSKYPFRYAFTVYDHLGNFVIRTSGEVTAAMMAQVAQDKDGMRALRFRWKPIANNGEPVGTGAYILRGLVQNTPGETQRGAQGETQIVNGTQRAVFATFGYLRQGH
jgi:fibro-slime domain-containing protein